MTRSSTTQPYGLWKSPISSRLLASGTRLSDVQWDTDGVSLVWVEGRSGNSVLVCASLDCADSPRDLTFDLSVRAQVGYGGGDFTVAQGTVFFVERSGRLYRQQIAHGSTHPITPEFGYAAAPTLSPDGHWLMYIHTYEEQDVLAVVDANGKQWPQQLAGGHDFFMQPCWHPDGQRIAYIAWDHPQMPWDGTTLFVSTLRFCPGSAPSAAETISIAGNTETAIFQPSFSPDGRWLAYVSDESGWSNIVLYDIQQGTHRTLTSTQAEHGKPAWAQGMRTYSWGHDSQHIFFVRNEQGFAKMYRQHIHEDHAEPVPGLEEYTWFDQPAVSPVADVLAVLASSSTRPTRLMVWGGWKVMPGKRMQGGIDSGARVLSRSLNEQVATSALAVAQPVSWETADGTTVHGLLYLPPSPSSTSSPQMPLPPAIIKIHGGPTGQAVASYQNDVQFFVTRGYVVLSVNHRGSTGYGRAYMEMLRGKWGVYDIEDTVSAAHYLATHGIADSGKLVVMGGSSGGYTVLETLCRAPGVFKAGICLYGISNLLTLATDTHKFEAHYMDSLIGQLPEEIALYHERSPIFHAELLQDPVAIFQGTEDTVVPPAQSEAMVGVLRRRGVPCDYHVYEGEGHGWRKRETVESFYQAVEAFLRQYVVYT